MLSGIVPNMNSDFENIAFDYYRHNGVGGFASVPAGRHVAPPDVDVGPWGWQWRDGACNLVSVPPESIPIPAKTLMDDIEKDAPGMYKTITDSAYSRSHECPFIVDEISMANFRNTLWKYQNENIILPRDAQVGVRKSVAAALGEWKGLVQEGEVGGTLYPYSVDFERLVDDLCGPRLPPETHSVDGDDRGSWTMSMDLGSEDETPLTPPEIPSMLKAVGTKAREEVVVVGVDRIDSFPSIRL